MDQETKKTQLQSRLIGKKAAGVANKNVNDGALNPDFTKKDGKTAMDKDGMPYNSDHGPFVYDLGSGANGRAVVCYGSGSWEYHTYKDNMERFNEESLGVSVTIYGTYLSALAYNLDS